MGSQAAETAETDQRPLTGNSTGLPDLELLPSLLQPFTRFGHSYGYAVQSILFLNDSAQTFTGCKSTGGSRLICSDILRSAQDGQLSLIEECISSRDP